MRNASGFALIVFAFFCSLSYQGFSQISVGAKGGINVSNLSGINDYQDFQSNSLVGFNLGGFITLNLGRHFAIQPELFYSTQGANLESALEENNLRLNYFNIPVMIKFLTGNGFYLEAGPQFGFKAGAISGEYENLDDEFKASDASACFGLGLQPMKSPIGIGARYNIGLGKVAELDNVVPNDVDVRSGVFQLSLYWRFLGGGSLKKK